jgi:hypothetical protein
MLLAGLATVIQQILYAVFLTVFGYNIVQMISTTLLPTILVHTVLILPIYWLLYLIQRLVWPKPVEV